LVLPLVASRQSTRRAGVIVTHDGGTIPIRNGCQAAGLRLRRFGHHFDDTLTVSNRCGALAPYHDP
jgi:hypothetical protein